MAFNSEYSKERIKAIREHFKLNQTEFAKRLGIKQSYLSALESGKREAPAKIVVLLIEKFAVSADWFMTGKGNMIITNSNKDTRDVINRTTSISNDEREGGVTNTNFLDEKLAKNVREDARDNTRKDRKLTIKSRLSHPENEKHKDLIRSEKIIKDKLFAIYSNRLNIEKILQILKALFNVDYDKSLIDEKLFMPEKNIYFFESEGERKEYIKGLNNRIKYLKSEFARLFHILYIKSQKPDFEIELKLERHLLITFDKLPFDYDPEV